MDITPRKLYNIKDWNIQYDLGSFYTRSKLNEWCEAKATHGGKAGPSDWFVDLTSDYDDSVIALENEGNELQQYIEEKWNELKMQQQELAISDEEIYYAVESLSCKYHRVQSKNSCYNQEDIIMSNNEYETCESRDIFNKDEISLDEMLEFDGVKENECLQKRRKQLYSVSNLDDSVALKLCNGEYDYQCPEWTHPAFDHELLVKYGELHLVSSYNNSNYNYIVMMSISICTFFMVSLGFIIKKWFKTINDQKLKSVGDDSEDVEYGTF